MIADYEILLFYGHSFPEVKTQQVLWGFLSVYPELVALIGWNVPNYQGVFLRGYGGQTSYHYGAVGHWSAGLGELQGDGIREISASFSTGGQARNRRSIRELWRSQEDRGTTGNMGEQETPIGVG